MLITINHSERHKHSDMLRHLLTPQQSFLLHESMKNAETEVKSRVTLYECLELFTRREKLSADDMWYVLSTCTCTRVSRCRYCNRCKEHREATKKFDLWRLPDVLVIHLKRFKYKYSFISRQSACSAGADVALSRVFRDKLDFLIEFPLEGLDMSPYIVNPKKDGVIYDLYAVSVRTATLQETKKEICTDNSRITLVVWPVVITQPPFEYCSFFFSLSLLYSHLSASLTLCAGGGWSVVLLQR